MRTAGLAGAILCGLFAADAANAQVPPPLPGIIERNAPVEPPRLGPPPAPEPPQAQRGPGEDRVVRLRRAELADATVLTTEALSGVLAPLQGQAVPLRAIEAARVAVLSAFRQAGYPFVSVSPTLAPNGGGSFDLRFAVVEAQVVEVRLDGDIGPAAVQALRFTEPLRGGPLRGAALERALLLISDIPGVAVQGVLQPVEGGQGALRLLLRLQRQAVSGVLSLDNRGFRLTGPGQGLLAVQANAFTQFGERTELSLYGTERLAQRFGQVSSEWFVGGSGLRVRLYAGYGDTEPRGVLAALGYQGDSTVGGLAVSYPVVRSRPANLTVVGQFDVLEGSLRANRGGAALAAHDSVQALRLGAQGQVLDPFALGPVPAGITGGTLRVHQGVGGGVMERASRAGARGDFTKVSAEVQRNQPIADLAPGLGLGVQVLAAGQWSADVLPVSEKFLLGGARITRGYYSGQVSGDKGWAAGVELQLDRGFDLPSLWGLPAARLQAQAYVFHDRGRAIQNAAGERDVSLASWGGGVRLFLDRLAQIEAEVVRRLERRPDGAGATLARPVVGYVNLVLRY